MPEDSTSLFVPKDRKAAREKERSKMADQFSKVYDKTMQPLEKVKISQLRSELTEKAVGHVLEIGSGTGANFPFYRNALKVDAIEPDLQMSKQSTAKIKKARIPIEVHTAKAEHLPFDENVFDTVVATLVFCTIPDPHKALQEIQRVAKPGASILFLEHVRMPQGLMGKVQDLMTPLWKKAFAGCHLNRDTLALIHNSELSVTKIDSHYKGFLLAIDCINEKQNMDLL